MINGESYVTVKLQTKQTERIIIRHGNVTQTMRYRQALISYASKLKQYSDTKPTVNIFIDR